MLQIRSLFVPALSALALAACSHEAPPASSAQPASAPSANTTAPRPAPAAPARAQLFGWLHKKSDGAPVPAGKLAIHYEDHQRSNLGARETHELLLRDPDRIVLSMLEVRVQEDGGFVADLPPKCWIHEVQYFPKPERELVGAKGVHLARVPLVSTRHVVDEPLESGALEIAFEIDAGLVARGKVFDARTREPLAGARVVLESAPPPLPLAESSADGAFELIGLDPREFQPRDGLLLVRVEADGHESVAQAVPWKEGQVGLGALEIALPPKSP